MGQIIKNAEKLIDAGEDVIEKTSQELDKAVDAGTDTRETTGEEVAKDLEKKANSAVSMAKRWGKERGKDHEWEY